MVSGTQDCTFWRDGVVELGFKLINNIILFFFWIDRLT